MNRLAVVTGGTRGIGEAVCLQLKEAGYQIAAVYARDDVAASKFAESTGIAIFKFDVGSFENCKEGIRMIQGDMNAPVEILVNNAGISRDSFLHKMSQEQWQTVIENNLTSCFNMSRAVIEGMRERQWGRIVNISSVNAQTGQYGQTNYAASKAGIQGFTRSLALENARSSITVNAIAAGYVNTDMMKTIPDKAMEKIISNIPVGRLAEPEEIGRCVEFLVNEKSAFITGTTLSVNGGQRMD